MIRTALVLLGMLGVAVGLARTRLVAVTVEGDSMIPTLRAGDRVLVVKLPLRWVRRRQLVVFAPPKGLLPESEPPWLIKRAVALPGDVVPAEVPNLAGTRVPADRFVVLGDNSARSFDSRRAGYLAADTLLGVVVRRLSA
ncbi:S26 family signal peptidase [Fodinicola acaciae]|uniref:S26 family signal peptidase n=1 Tax=Fodinicola acaciae TaxID=2681555 RepID=UPI0013D51DE6|nr:S26 family signal peptidase [Fodinicola acaciae]